MGKLTDEQVENWRKVLTSILGPYALIMPRENVQAIRDKMESEQHLAQQTSRLSSDTSELIDDERHDP
jgi:hypothetical protein